MRQYRLDELPQLINILLGDMSFVGTRPEVVKICREYTDEDGHIAFTGGSNI